MANQFHIDDELDRKILELNDVICSFERACSREYLVLIIPAEKDEQIVASDCGKPVDVRRFEPETLVDAWRSRRK